MTNEKALYGRVALVTGAGSGMGRTHCEVMAERGAHVIVQELIPERAEEVAAAIRAAGGSAEAMPGDASDVARMKALIGEAEQRLGHIDILVNNAGISGLQAPFEQVDEAAFDRMLTVHLKSAFFCAQAVVPGMKARRYGRIINMSSMFAMKGSPDAPHYTVAKGGMLGLTKALARELAAWNITVNAIAPGLVKSEMTMKSIKDERIFDERAQFVPMKRLATARDVSLTVAFLASDDAALVTGQTISPSGGDVIPGV